MQKVCLRSWKPEMRSKCLYSVLEAFRLHVYKLCAAALQANCVGDSKANLNEAGATECLCENRIVLYRSFRGTFDQSLH